MENINGKSRVTLRLSTGRLESCFTLGASDKAVPPSATYRRWSNANNLFHAP
jgi:hypothetical protein